MNEFKNIVFGHKTSSAMTSILTNGREYLLNNAASFVHIDFIDMSIRDTADDELIATIRTRATLVRYNCKDKLQNIKLKTETLNTYQLALEYVETYTGYENVYALTGRNTSENRHLARKFILSGLSCSNYSGTIEEARRDLLNQYSSYITSTIFEPNNVRAQENIPRVNTWLVSLLG
ncbi:MAG: hypothetical protein JHC33_05425 [Ignisphaera sp.]|nr:hypothetical protein [Ignisphaera sp.]